MTSSPLQITLPNGQMIQSTHTCNLEILWLTNTVTEAHIVPSLSYSSLISTRKFIDLGCKVIFDIDEYRIHYKGVLVLTGKTDRTTGLWNLSTNPREKTSAITSIKNQNLQCRPHQHVPHSANNLHTLPSLQNRVKYMHETFFCPPHSTLLAAINNHQLKGYPFVTAENVRKYLPMSPATSKGRMKRPRTGIRSTRAKAPKSHCATLGHKSPIIN